MTCMVDESAAYSGLRLAELMASLSLAIDLGVGQPMEWVMRCCLLAVNLSRTLGLSESEQQDVYYLSLLQHVSCTATATQDAALFGDELALAEVFTTDTENPLEAIRLLLDITGKGQPLLQRARRLPGVLLGGKQKASELRTNRCEAAERLAAALGFPLHIQQALWQIYERWDGRGIPNSIKGQNIVLPIRIIHIAQDATTFYLLVGVEATVEVIRRRSGQMYDPELAQAFCRAAPELLASIDTESIWDAVLTAEPGTPVWLSDERFEAAMQAVGDFTDFKSPYTLGHSRAVAELVEAAAHQYGLPKSDGIGLRHAGCLHDIGRVGITSAIWNKGGTLTESEWERVRLHPYYTERIFARSPVLSPLTALAALHHERLDGSGYHRGLAGGSLSAPARLLAAANTYCALIEPRPHRPLRTAEQAADELRREARTGRMDEKAVDSVLNAAGHRIRPARRASTSLSEREIEVLRLIARGLSNRQIGGQLSITEKTVEHHVTHIYNKIGVSTRAGATLFAVQNYLLN